MTDLIISEWLKVRSVRSTSYLLLVGGLAMLALAVLVAVFRVTTFDDLSAADRADFSPIGTGIGDAGLFAPLVFGAFGALAITAEYATGAIRPSLVAVPQRHAFLLAKIVTTVTTGLVAGVLLVWALYGVTQAVIGDRPIGTSLSSAVGELLAMTVMLTVVTLVGLGLGTLTRSTAGAIVILAGLVYALPVLGDQLPQPWGERLISVTLFGLQGQLAGGWQDPPFTPPAAFGLLVAWAAAALAAGGVVLARRDA